MQTGRNTSLRVVVRQCCVCLYGPKSLTGFKLYATSANIVVVPRKRLTQHAGANNTACCWPTMLRSFAWAFRFSIASRTVGRVYCDIILCSILLLLTMGILLLLTSSTFWLLLFNFYIINLPIMCFPFHYFVR